MKVVLRGARRTGKTSLLRRLQGQPVPPEYAATPEIETAVIRWAYKSSDDKM
jgi:GTPase SAR1 family protein